MIPDHYTAAQDRLADACRASADQDHDDAMRSLHFAQVHATLALVDAITHNAGQDEAVDEV